MRSSNIFTTVCVRNAANMIYMVLLRLRLDSPVVVRRAAHGSILVASAALAGHRAVQRGVEVRGRVGPGIPNRVRHVENKIISIFAQFCGSPSRIPDLQQ